MFKARNERLTLERQIQPLEGKDIPAFFPALVCLTFRHFGHLWHFAIASVSAKCYSASHDNA